MKLLTATGVALALAGVAAVGSSGSVERGAGGIPVADRASLRGRVAYSARGGIWVMNANGSGRRRLTRSGRGVDFDPSWSPDGRAIVFRTSRGHLRDPNGSGAEGIFVVNVRTRRQREIQPRRGGLFPAWSPDGALIAFSGLRGGRRGDTIHVMTPRGTRVRDLGGGGAQSARSGRPTAAGLPTAATAETGTGPSG
ncbi:MAG TPA: hypothetical protein VGJ27_01645 [Gaiellaceae bacterium]|jgi:dipeptidyl aminopeptidase/acylaminoacyl peptidase